MGHCGPLYLSTWDQPAASSLQLDLIPSFDPGIVVFDPDHAISTTLLTRLASATSAIIQQLCQPFVHPGLNDNDCCSPFCLSSILQDSGAQGSNFVSRQIFDQLPLSIRNLSRLTNRVVRSGDSRSSRSPYLTLLVTYMLTACITVCVMFSVMMLS